MITSQKDSNKQLYAKLFEQATAELREAKILADDASINSLEQYFCNLKDLHGLSDRYIMLPLDEEPFDIDANTRAITVPANFKKSGLGVQGDEIAETIFFRIDRFFDAMDFDTCQVFAQWQGVDGIPYVTPIVMKDVMSQPGKIIYAWPISSKLTRNSGSVKFSLRFVKYDATKMITYSFSTLTATAIINPGLNFDIFETKVDDADDLFNFAIVNSTSVSGIPAKQPVFIVDLPSEEGALRKKLYLEIADDGTRTFTLSVSTKVADTGAIRYEWYHRRPESFSANMGPGVDRYEVTADETPDATKNYYKKVNETTWEFYDVTNGFDAEIPAYERYNDFVLSGTEVVSIDDPKSITGQYYVKAINRLGSVEAEKESIVVEFPTATTPVIVENGDLEDGIIGRDSGTLTAKCSVDEHSITHFAWKKDMNKDGEFATEVHTYVDNTSTTPEGVFAPSEPGYYKVDITSEINLDAISVSSSIVRVTNEPEAVVFDEESAEGADDVYVNINVTESVVPGLLSVPGTDVSELPKDFQSDEITYIWYQDIDNEGVLTDGVIDADAIPFTEPSDSPALKVDDSLQDMQLRCVAANYLNGAVTYSSSKLYAFGGRATN